MQADHPMQTEHPLTPMLAKLSRQSRLSDEARAALLGLPHRIVDLDRSAFIAREGERSTHCCLILSGFAYAYKLTGSGNRQVMAVHVRGDLIDLRGGPRIAPFNLQPLSRVKAALIPRQALLELALSNAQIAESFWTEATIVQSTLGEWLLNIGRRDARSRICHLLCELALRQEAAGICDGPDYEWPMTQEQLADATALTSVHVNRTLQGLRADGLLKTKNRRIAVANWAALREIGDFTSAYLDLADAAGPERENAPPRALELSEA